MDCVLRVRNGNNRQLVPRVGWNIVVENIKKFNFVHIFMTDRLGNEKELQDSFFFFYWAKYKNIKNIQIAKFH